MGLRLLIIAGILSLATICLVLFIYKKKSLNDIEARSYYGLPHRFECADKSIIAVIDFSCDICKTQILEIKKLSSLINADYKVYLLASNVSSIADSLNFDRQRILISNTFVGHFDVKGTPTFLLFENCKVKKKIEGISSAEYLVKIFQAPDFR